MKVFYDFLLAQQDYTKKILDMEFAKSKDYEMYILEHFLAIKMKMKTNMICWNIKIQNFYFIMSTIGLMELIN